MSDQASEDADKGEPYPGPVPRRDGYGRWMPGSTGNAAGRPVLLGPVRDLARVYTDVAVMALVDVARSATAPPAARVAAARELLDRGHGRAQAGEPMRRPVEAMSDEDLHEAMGDEAALAEAAAAVGVMRIEAPPAEAGALDPAAEEGLSRG